MGEVAVMVGASVPVVSQGCGVVGKLWLGQDCC